MLRLSLPFIALLLAAAIPASAKLKQAAMRLPPELAQVERLPVAGRQGWKRIEQVSFGANRVSNVDRSLTKGSSLQILFYEGAKARQTFGFSVDGAGFEPWQGEAESTVRRRVLELNVDIELRNRSGFAARLAPAARPDDAWTLKLLETRDRPLAGTLKRNDSVVNVTGTNRLENTIFRLGETAGYIFEIAGKPVAAVEVINDGAVWLAPDLAADLRAPVTAAISSLLLFEELRKTLPE